MASADAKREPLVVLVVEDEPLVRMIIVDTLADAGFEVLQASDAHEALRLFEAKAEVAVVLTDIDMPGGMDGLELRIA
jgi:CheY-like chemotaxis protein